MEYFVVAVSFAAPFVSDRDESFVEGGSPLAALTTFVKTYRHPAGLYFAALFGSSDDYHKDRDPLVKWTCNHELRLAHLRKSLNIRSTLVKKPGLFELDGKDYKVDDPKGGEFSEVCG